MSKQLFAIEEARKIRRQFFIVLSTSGVILVSGATIVRWLESLNWVDSFYFALISLTTVGYGDILPTRPVTKIFVMFYLVIGIGVIATMINLFVKYAVARHIIKEYESSKK